MPKKTAKSTGLPRINILQREKLIFVIDQISQLNSSMTKGYTTPSDLVEDARPLIKQALEIYENE